MDLNVIKMFRQISSCGSLVNQLMKQSQEKYEDIHFI